MKSQPYYLMLAGSLATFVCSVATASAEPDVKQRPDSYREPNTLKDKNSSVKQEKGNPALEHTPQGFIYSALLGGLKEVQMSQIALERSQNTEIKAFARRVIEDHSKFNTQLLRMAERRAWRMPATNLFSAPHNPVAAGLEPGRDLRRDPNDATLVDSDRVDSPSPATVEPEPRDVSSGRQSGNRDVAERQKEERRWQERTELQRRLAIDALRNTSSADFDKVYARETVRGHSQAMRKYAQTSQISSDEEIRTFAKDTLPRLKEHHRQAKQLALSLGVVIGQSDAEKISPTALGKRGPE